MVAASWRMSPPMSLHGSFNLADTLSSALFFRNVFGVAAEKALSAFIALSALGNILALMFSQGRGMLIPPPHPCVR